MAFSGGIGLDRLQRREYKKVKDTCERRKKGMSKLGPKKDKGEAKKKQMQQQLAALKRKQEGKKK